LRAAAGSLLSLTLRHSTVPRDAVGITAVVWFVDAIAVRTVAHALDLSLSLHEAFLLIAALGLSSAAPSTPGYIGIYQFVSTTVLMPLGFTRSHALALVVLYQGVLYCLILFWGAIFSWTVASDWLELTKVPPGSDGASDV